MLIRFYLFTLCFLGVPFLSFPQNNEQPNGKIKYTSDYIFNDGVYLSLKDFQQDNPSYTAFNIIKLTPFTNSYLKKIQITVFDSAKNTLTGLWGYAYKGDVFIAHARSNYYFKLIVIGSLCYYRGLADSRIRYSQMDLFRGYSDNSMFKEYMMDFNTGEIFLFNYKKFKTYLQNNDIYLYEDLIKQKKKKKIIFNYLLKYNERHPIWYNAEP